METVSTIFNDSKYCTHNSFDTFTGEKIIVDRLIHSFEYTIQGYSLPDDLLTGSIFSNVAESGLRRDFVPFERGYLFLHTQESIKYITARGVFRHYDERDAALVKLKERFPTKESPVNTVPINFWNWTQNHGPFRLIRHLDVPDWQTIQGNYPRTIKNQLQSLMDLKGSDDLIGKLLLWRGLPGTGKTFALRSLIKEWSRWCKAHYIIDPDAFFVSAEYLMTVIPSICSDTDEDDDEVPVPANFDGVSGDGKPSKHWNLLILEDTGEMVSADAKQRTGQALSKLLNIADGLLGQGFRLLTLITTNEDISNLHPAISRAGRCMCNLHFQNFSEHEAKEWLRERGHNDRISSSDHSLANLYSELNKNRVISNQTESRIGFKAA